jgi:hypothetical protein
MYAKGSEYARKAVAVAFLICGIGLIVSARREEWLRTVHRWDIGVWPFVRQFFELSLHACLAATTVLIVESLTRRWKRRALNFTELLFVAVFGLVAYGLAIAGLFWMTNSSDKGGVRNPATLESSAQADDKDVYSNHF